MNSAFRKLCTPSLIALVLSNTACSTNDTQVTPQHKTDKALLTQENQVDANGLPVLSQQQQNAGIICKREPVTGTRISKKRCTTLEQREQAKREAENSLMNTQRQSVGPTVTQ